MQYGMAFEGDPQPFDQIIEVEGVKIVVDPNSMQYLRGVTIDYEDNLMGGGFRIENPNAASSCGCGQSFRTAGSGPAPGHGGGGCI
jgi:iron-sulfur cluster assembly protein